MHWMLHKLNVCTAVVSAFKLSCFPHTYTYIRMYVHAYVCMYCMHQLLLNAFCRNFKIKPLEMETPLKLGVYKLSPGESPYYSVITCIYIHRCTYMYMCMCTYCRCILCVILWGV